MLQLVRKCDEKIHFTNILGRVLGLKHIYSLKCVKIAGGIPFSNSLYLLLLRVPCNIVL